MSDHGHPAVDATPDVNDVIADPNDVSVHIDEAIDAVIAAVSAPSPMAEDHIQLADVQPQVASPQTGLEDEAGEDEDDDEEVHRPRRRVGSAFQGGYLFLIFYGTRNRTYKQNKFMGDIFLILWVLGTNEL